MVLHAFTFSGQQYNRNLCGQKRYIETNFYIYWKTINKIFWYFCVFKKKKIFTIPTHNTTVWSTHCCKCESQLIRNTIYFRITVKPGVYYIQTDLDRIWFFILDRFWQKKNINRNKEIEMNFFLLLSCYNTYLCITKCKPLKHVTCR